jgi:hypothetical protein
MWLPRSRSEMGPRNGKIRASGLSIPEAVRQFGGPQIVVSREMLWTETSMQKREAGLERYYLLVAMLLTVAIFVSAVTAARAVEKRLKGMDRTVLSIAALLEGLAASTQAASFRHEIQVSAGVCIVAEARGQQLPVSIV